MFCTFKLFVFFFFLFLHKQMTSEDMMDGEMLHC